MGSKESDLRVPRVQAEAVKMKESPLIEGSLYEATVIAVRGEST